jgi:hypothetical protein
MAVRPPALRGIARQRLWWVRLHFLLRLVGLTGLLACAVGLVLAGHRGLLGSWLASWPDARSTLEQTLRGESDQPAAYLVVYGGLAALFALVIELLVSLRVAAGRRSVFGLNAAVQAALAVALLVGVNWFSYHHSLRFDWTRGQLFTLPAQTRDQLRQLHDETTIVVYQRHKTFGNLSAKPDRYDYAAERKVVEKVKDLVDQFRELGGRFKVHVLDVEEEGYEDRLAEITRDRPELRKAIDEAPENSIFFHAHPRAEQGGRELVQRLSFNEFYRLDKTASQNASGGRGNLVLLAQGSGADGRGIQPFADKVFNLDERRPRIGIAVIHEYLTSRGPEEYGVPGLKKALTAHGFEVRDVVLRQGWGAGVPTPAVSTYEESKLDRLEGRLRVLDRILRDRRRAIDEVTRREPDHPLLPALREAQESDTRNRDKLRKERDTLDLDSLLEQKRMTDLHAKLSGVLAECDLLLVLRPTLMDVVQGRAIPPWLHKLDDAHFAAVRDFLKAGKPLLVCVGPDNEREDPRRRTPPEFAGPDPLVGLLEKLGIQLGKQTVLFDAENEAFAEVRRDVLTPGAGVKVPPLIFDWPAGTGYPPEFAARYAAGVWKPNPIRTGLRLAARSLGKDQTLELRLRHPRPIYYELATDRPRPRWDPTILMTSAESWNEDNPFPNEETGDVPTFKGSGPDDPHRGTLDVRRRGPFPVGVALETAPPAEWYAPAEARPEAVRVAVIGQGSFVIAPDLDPARERLMLDTCNWLLGRDDALPVAGPAWSFPRVAVADQELWLWAMRLGLPVLFAFLGTVVLLVRRLR